jgi:hypothetical protein
MLDQIADIKALLGVVTVAGGILGAALATYNSKLNRAAVEAVEKQKIKKKGELVDEDIKSLKAKVAELAKIAHSGDIRHARQAEILEGVLKSVEDLSDDFKFMLTLLVGKDK